MTAKEARVGKRIETKAAEKGTLVHADLAVVTMVMIQTEDRHLAKATVRLTPQEAATTMEMAIARHHQTTKAIPLMVPKAFGQPCRVKAAGQPQSRC